MIFGCINLFTLSPVFMLCRSGSRQDGILLFAVRGNANWEIDGNQKTVLAIRYEPVPFLKVLENRFAGLRRNLTASNLLTG